MFLFSEKTGSCCRDFKVSDTHVPATRGVAEKPKRWRKNVVTYEFSGICVFVGLYCIVRCFCYFVHPFCSIENILNMTVCTAG